ncbi:hypothetical protein ACU4GA_30775 [Methylobacterium oryzae CBMB20]
MSRSVKSARRCTFGLLVFIRSGMLFIAATPFTAMAVPSVFDQSSTRGGTPPAANWIVPESRASFIAAPPARVR